MMNTRAWRTTVTVILVTAGLCLALVGCSGDGEKPTTTSAMGVTTERTSSTTGLSVIDGEGVIQDDDLSTFENKDPFIQQAVAPITTVSTTTTTVPKPSTTSTTKAPTTTYYTTTKWTTTTKVTTTTTSSTTTTTCPSTTTTTTFLHTLDVVSVALVETVPVVTFKVDSLTYTNKMVGDVVSTTWGEIQVLAIDVPGQVATFLHGSETVTLGVGDPPIHE